MSQVTLVELKDIQLPDSMKRAMARQAEAEREKRAKIIAAEGESLAAAALGDASDTMMAHPLALQLRNLQTLVELGVDKNTTVVFPAPLMTTIAELGAFLARESGAAAQPEPQPQPPIPIPAAAARWPMGHPLRRAGHDRRADAHGRDRVELLADAPRRALPPGDDSGCRTGSARAPRRRGPWPRGRSRSVARAGPRWTSASSSGCSRTPRR